MSDIIPAVYEDGIFRPLERPVGLAEHQPVQLLLVAGTAGRPAAVPLKDDLRFVRETMGAWRVVDPEFRRWLAEEISLFDEGDDGAG